MALYKNKYGLLGKLFFYLVKMRLKFTYNAHASVTVEYALILPIFLGVLLAIFEIAILIVNLSVLEAGVEAGKSVILDGHIRNLGTDAAKQAAFRQVFCDKAGSLLNCDRVTFDIQSYPFNNNITIINPVANGRLDTTGFAMNFGNQCDFVVIRAYYEIISMAGLIRTDVQNLGGFNNLIHATAVVKNEPLNNC